MGGTMANIGFDRLRAVAESTFFDTCQINSYTSGSDSYHDIIKTWSTSSCPINCGVTNNSGNKQYTPEGETRTTYDAQIRLPLSTIVSQLDQITVLTKSGCPINAQYQILSLEKGISIIAKCQRLEV